jgi:iron complex outermembrane receptor protein
MHNPQQDLGELLKNSGLSYRFTDAKTVVLFRQETRYDSTSPNNAYLLPVVQVVGGSSKSDETTLPKVTVEADSAYDPEYYSDPYNKDYVIPNATAGTKTDTPIMETPLNVQVISKQVLKDQQVINLDQALKNVSGVTTSNNVANLSFDGGSPQAIVLRGFESQTFFRNGFRLQQGAASRAMANVESVEVLKGSSAILYGLVEPGGMVNVITKQPLATPYYGFNQQFGSYDLYRTTIDATGPLTKNKDLLYRMNVSYENSGSFREFVDKEDVFLAPVLKWNISPSTQATFELEYNHKHFGADAGINPMFKGKLIDMPRSRNYGEFSPATTETIYGGFNWSHQFNDDWAIKHQFSVNQQSNIQPHFLLGGSVDNNNVYRTFDADDTQYNTYSTNLDLTGHFDTGVLKHTLLIGGDYYRLDTKLNKFSGFNPTTFESFLSAINRNNPIHPGTPFLGPLQQFDASRNHTDQFGLYIQDQIKLPYNIDVMGGIRYQYIHQKVNNQVPAIGLADIHGATQDAVTPRVGITWQPKSWLSLYANYAESFGANQGLVSPGKTVPPTSAEQFEGGIKAEFFNGRLRATLAYYDLTKTNIASPHPDPKLAQSFSVVTGEARSRGPELDITGEILPGWNIIATWSNTDVRVTKTNSKNDPGLDGLVPVGGRFFNVPRNTGSFWSTYEVQDGDLKGFKLGGGVTVRDGQNGCCSNPASSIPGYATVDLLAAYSLDVGKTKVTAQFNVSNLLDKHYFTGLLGPNNTNAAGFASALVDFGQPRTFMGSINVQY